jgi:hypothetical protein
LLMIGWSTMRKVKPYYVGTRCNNTLENFWATGSRA